jgi:dolichol-phosphate mannosyltransferase
MSSTVVHTARNGFKPVVLIIPARLLQARRFIKFCLVGASGLAVDMATLFLFADPRCLGLGFVFSKICAAEVAMINNFIWNELWTFRRPSPRGEGRRGSAQVQALPDWNGLGRRFLAFNAICGIGVGLAVLLLHAFHGLLGWNLYASNFIAILLVTFWNFAANSRWNWGTRQ